MSIIRELQLVRPSTETDTRSVRCVLNKEKYYPYKCQSGQELKEDDHPKPVEFCEKFPEKVDEDPEFLKNVVFSDEASFYLNGAVNKHNERYWCNENPYWKVEEHTQNPQKVNVWCGIMGQHLMGPLFVEGIMTGQKYRDLLETAIVPRLQELFPGDLFQRVWFQQDGAP